MAQTHNVPSLRSIRAPCHRLTCLPRGLHLCPYAPCWCGLTRPGHIVCSWARPCTARQLAALCWSAGGPPAKLVACQWQAPWQICTVMCTTAWRYRRCCKLGEAVSVACERACKCTPAAAGSRPAPAARAAAWCFAPRSSQLSKPGRV